MNISFFFLVQSNLGGFNLLTSWLEAYVNYWWAADYEIDISFIIIGDRLGSQASCKILLERKKKKEERKKIKSWREEDCSAGYPTFLVLQILSVRQFTSFSVDSLSLLSSRLGHANAIFLSEPDVSPICYSCTFPSLISPIKIYSFPFLINSISDLLSFSSLPNRFFFVFTLRPSILFP